MAVSSDCYIISIVGLVIAGINCHYNVFNLDDTTGKEKILYERNKWLYVKEINRKRRNKIFSVKFLSLEKNLDWKFIEFWIELDLTEANNRWRFILPARVSEKYKIKSFCFFLFLTRRSLERVKNWLSANVYSTNFQT